MSEMTLLQRTILNCNNISPDLKLEELRNRFEYPAE
jgi:hypothetical protein